MQEVAVLASFVYHTANRDDQLPRKPLPKAPPKRPEVKKDAAAASPSGQ